MKFRLYLAWLAAVLLLVACEGGNGGEGGKGNSNGDGPKEELPDNPNNPDNPDNPNSDSQGGATLPGVTTEVEPAVIKTAVTGETDVGRNASLLKPNECLREFEG